MIIKYKDKTPEVSKAAFIAENATITGDVELGEGSSVWFGAVVRGDGSAIKIGERSNIQDNCVLHSEPDFPVTIGEGVTVGHCAVVHGCTVEDGCLIGMRSVIMDGAVIGRNCIVGAGALVTQHKKFEEGSLILGSPAVAVRKLSEEEIQACLRSERIYVEKASIYAAQER